MGMSRFAQMEIEGTTTCFEKEREGVLIWASASLEHFVIHLECGPWVVLRGLGEGPDDGVVGEKVGFWDMGKEKAGEGEVGGGGSEEEDATGDEGVAEETRDEGVGEEGEEAAEGEWGGGGEGEEARVA